MDVSAGILCYAMPPSSDEIYFLLARNQPTKSVDAEIAGGQGSRKKRHWSDFAGKTEGDETPERTAAREFYEEGMGLVCTCPIDGECKLSLHKPSYISQVAESLSKGEYTAKLRVCVNHGACADGRQRKYHTTYVRRVRWDPDLPSDFSSMRGKLLTCPHAVQDHPAVMRAACGETGSTSLSVAPEYLEKEVLQYWSVARLREVLLEGGAYKKETFNPLFIPTLAVALDLFARERVETMTYVIECWPASLSRHRHILSTIRSMHPHRERALSGGKQKSAHISTAQAIEDGGEGTGRGTQREGECTGDSSE